MVFDFDFTCGFSGEPQTLEVLFFFLLLFCLLSVVRGFGKLIKLYVVCYLFSHAAAKSS